MLVFGTLLFLVLLFSLLFVARMQSMSHTTFVSRHSDNILAETAKRLMRSQNHTREPLKGEEEGRVNILLLGKTGKNYPGTDLTDTIIIGSIDTKTNKTSMMSLPRDLYVRIGDTQSSTKINALYLYGKKQNTEDSFEFIRSAVEEVTGLPIHYTVTVDYDAFVRVVDALGGINVTVERDFYDPRYPGPNYSYETFELKKGFHTLDGETALKYVRERHDDPQGDFGRSARQQQVLQSIKNKVFTLETFLNPLTLYSLLGTLEDTVRTDLSPKEMESLVSLIQQVDTHNVHNYVVDAWKRDSLLRVSHINLENGVRMFALVPRTGNYQEIHETARNIFALESQTARRERIESEQPNILLLNTNQNNRVTSQVTELLEDLGFREISTNTPADTTPLPRSFVIKHSENSKNYSLDELLKKIPASLAGESLSTYLPKNIPQDTDFIVLLGSDVVPHYTWEKASVEEYLKGE